MIAGLSAPPELAMSTVIASQSSAICARASVSKACVASGRARSSQRSVHQNTPLEARMKPPTR